MCVHDRNVLVDTNGAVIYFSHTDPSDIFIVIDRADEHLRIGVRVSLRRGDIVDDRVKKRLHICSRFF